MLSDKIINDLEYITKNHLYRHIKNYKKQSNFKLTDSNNNQYTSFACNDYLGMSQNPEVINNAVESIKIYGLGSTSSRLVTGSNELYNQLETLIAQYYHAEKSLIFSSGYMANIGLISTIIDKNDIIIADKFIHASIIDAIKLSGATLKRFNHNNIIHCEKILSEIKNTYNNVFIISQTIFSMDGDLGKVNELHNLALKYNGYLITDDAHGFGVLPHYILSSRHIVTGSLAKAVGTYGGFVVANKLIINYLHNKARTLIYTTSLPFNIIAASIKSLEIIINRDHNFKNKPIENANYFCKLMNISQTGSMIIPLIIGDNEKAINISHKLKENNILTIAIRTPTVPQNTARIRLTFANYHSKDDIELLATAISTIIST